MRVNVFRRPAAVLFERLLVTAFLVTAVATVFLVYVCIARITRKLATAFYILLRTAVRKRYIAMGSWTVGYLVFIVAVPYLSFAVATDLLVSVLVTVALFCTTVGIFLAVIGNRVHL